MFLIGNRAFTGTRPAHYRGPKVHDVRPDAVAESIEMVVDAFNVSRLCAEASGLKPTWAPAVPDDSLGVRIVGPGDHQRDGNVYGRPWR